MTPEMESQVYQDLGAIKVGIQNLNQLLATHTEQDMTQFTTMTETIQGVETKVDQIIKDLAIDTALKKQHEQFIRKIATNRAALVSIACGIAATLFQTFGYAIYQHYFG